MCQANQVRRDPDLVPTRNVSHIIVSDIRTQKMRVYHFTRGDSNGSKDMKSLLGGKGANLCEMASLGACPCDVP